jgi:hypothetical protein
MTDDTYPQADSFLHNDRNDIDRLIQLMFGARDGTDQGLARGAGGRCPTLRNNKCRQVIAPP